MYILIFILIGTSTGSAGKTSLAVEFSSKKTCEAALKEFTVNYYYHSDYYAVCVKK